MIVLKIPNMRSLYPNTLAHAHVQGKIRRELVTLSSLAI